ncbi:MAG TPA: hypothetical protein EYQ21_02130 [Flavobacteriales bacterium]|jgi:phosphopentomutase|nr:hypothetical protein [Flavobacteriales bacterium]
MHGLSTIKKQNKSTHNPYDSQGNKVTGECLNTFQATMIAEGHWELAGFIVSELGVDEANSLFIKANQYLIDTGIAWKLQGYFGRQARLLIDAKVCHGTKRGLA